MARLLAKGAAEAVHWHIIIVGAAHNSEAVGRRSNGRSRAGSVGWVAAKESDSGAKLRASKRDHVLAIRAYQHGGIVKGRVAYRT